MIGGKFPWRVGVTAIMVMGWIVLGMLTAFPLKWAWNYCMPYLFDLPIIGWGHAWCLIIVSAFLVRPSPRIGKD